MNGLTKHRYWESGWGRWQIWFDYVGAGDDLEPLRIIPTLLQGFLVGTPKASKASSRTNLLCVLNLGFSWDSKECSYVSISYTTYLYIVVYPDRCKISDKELGLPSLSNVRLPVVELPDGTQLFAPTIREIAQRLLAIAQVIWLLDQTYSKMVVRRSAGRWTATPSF